jgi:hypothetical protein
MLRDFMVKADAGITAQATRMRPVITMRMGFMVNGVGACELKKGRIGEVQSIYNQDQHGDEAA